ncbi:MAG: hypothetical protein WCY91_01990, partial [Acidithiobacillus sp.]
AVAHFAIQVRCIHSVFISQAAASVSSFSDVDIEEAARKNKATPFLSMLFLISTMLFVVWKPRPSRSQEMSTPIRNVDEGHGFSWRQGIQGTIELKLQLKHIARFERKPPAVWG